MAKKSIFAAFIDDQHIFSSQFAHHSSMSQSLSNSNTNARTLHIET
jgi:hypothetical protein